MRREEREQRGLELLAEAVKLLKKLVNEEEPQITGFVIQQENPMLSIAPGNSPVFTATPVPSTSVPATPPTWTTSDEVNAPISVDPTGLIATVDIPATATVGASFTLTISYTNADGHVATGSISESIVAAASPDISSFTIAQTT